MITLPLNGAFKCLEGGEMKLFGFGKSKEGRCAEARFDEGKAAQDQAYAKAYQMGQDAGAAMAAATDQFVVLRARPLAERLYTVFLTLVDKAARETDGSPIDAVRVQFRIFLKELENFREKSIYECCMQVDEWLLIADQVGSRANFEEYIVSKIEDVYADILSRAVNKTSELVEVLRSMGFKGDITGD
jgi:hypothetical protein